MKQNELRIISVIHKSNKSGISIKDGYVKRFGYIPKKEDKVQFAVMAVNNVCGLTSQKSFIEPVLMC